ncbi:M15 family metallopeptidase [Demequina mangrovi]|uniref:M15 family metallopeptidase n=1 Tax=Demequina mangrovi TaxID=1043493 RepID=UPI001F2E4AC2|nr:M15 family metallopeptidase [Demequina mangrovi]
MRTSKRRQRVLTRGGVLFGFLAAMVVYPVMGTIAPYANAAEQIPGVVKGESPTTATAILGAAPQFESSDLPLPSVDEQAGAILTSADVPVASNLLPDCDPDYDPDMSNGRLSSDQLCDLWVAGESMRPDAALALAALNERFRAQFGTDICIADTYRDIYSQYATKASRGYLAATPGTSMHGLGLAVDLCRSHASGVYFSWLSINAGNYGFMNPDWAKTSKYEPWHWEYQTQDQY